MGSGGVDVDVSVNFSNNKYIEFKNKPDISYHRLKLSDSP